MRRHYIAVYLLLAVVAWLARGVPPVAPRVDLVLAIDSTGRMAGEIEELKRNVRSMVNVPSARFGLVSYGDHGVARAEPLTADRASFVQAVDGLRAEGGGEAVDEALHLAVEEMNWDAEPHTRRVVVLVGDSGPRGRYDCRELARVAHERHIRIDCLGCGGSGERELREVATIADGRFELWTAGGLSSLVRYGTRP